MQSGRSVGGVSKCTRVLVDNLINYSFVGMLPSICLANTFCRLGSFGLPDLRVNLPHVRLGKLLILVRWVGGIICSGDVLEDGSVLEIVSLVLVASLGERVATSRQSLIGCLTYEKKLQMRRPANKRKTIRHVADE